MSIQLNCPCGASFKAPEGYAGKRVICPNCRKAIVIPKVGLERKPSTTKTKTKRKSVSEVMAKAPKRSLQKSVFTPSVPKTYRAKSQVNKALQKKRHGSASKTSMIVISMIVFGIINASGFGAYLYMNWRATEYTYETTTLKTKPSSTDPIASSLQQLPLSNKLDQQSHSKSRPEERAPAPKTLVTIVPKVSIKKELFAHQPEPSSTQATDIDVEVASSAQATDIDVEVASSAQAIDIDMEQVSSTQAIAMEVITPPKTSAKVHRIKLDERTSVKRSSLSGVVPPSQIESQDEKNLGLNKRPAEITTISAPEQSPSIAVMRTTDDEKFIAW